ncbi:hypothetical protein [Candidatus Uabimicrobium amorphum]|uniref:Uncharacterized protein n=1 Tax=Uabimicrobium amorphum TaxID=2596890 RepID=A0A5S9F5H3_UABAM|nr:hypothetical protein [Candidatus Uabimicrobium amorphum]BBM85659.1 hypothetical protein UABAM_04033 [Candidatus Uabimicrobium amorphum]
MSKKKKKKFLTKKKMAAGAIVATLIYFAPRGGDFLKFLPVVTSDSMQETQENPQEEKDKQQQDKSTQNENKQPQPQQIEEINLRMRFVNGELYVGNWPCPDKNALEKTIKKLLTKYNDKEVRIKYYRDGNDPYKASYAAQKLLKKAGFHVTIHKGDAE